jgi:hypothetical protein
MGCADYHPAPCVLFCPFVGCKKGRHQLNGPSLISQLFSHWQDKAHASNPAAKALEARHRTGIEPLHGLSPLRLAAAAASLPAAAAALLLLRRCCCC